MQFPTPVFPGASPSIPSVAYHGCHPLECTAGQRVNDCAHSKVLGLGPTRSLLCWVLCPSGECDKAETDGDTCCAEMQTQRARREGGMGGAEAECGVSVGQLGGGPLRVSKAGWTQLAPVFSLLTECVPPAFQVRPGPLCPPGSCWPLCRMAFLVPRGTQENEGEKLLEHSLQISRSFFCAVVTRGT